MREGEACFTRAIAQAQEELSTSIEVQALLARAQARIALHDIQGAGRDIENAHSLEREDANGLCEYAILLRARGNLTGAIDVFRRAVKVGGRDDAEFHLGVTLRERDLARRFVGGRRNSGPLDPQSHWHTEGDYLFAVGCAVDVLCRMERWHQAEALLGELPADQISVRGAPYPARADRTSRGDTAKASQLGDAALGDLRMETTADERRNLAVLLHDLGRYG